MTSLILIRGLPGSGKTTYAQSLLKKGMKHFEADMYHTRNGVYDYQVSKARQGHEWCLNETWKALENGKSVIVSNTFTTYQELAPYLDVAEELDVKVEITKCVGEFDSEHGVPEAIIRKMADRWEDIDEEKIYDPLEEGFPARRIK
jgi:Predicted kinase